MEIAPPCASPRWRGTAHIGRWGLETASIPAALIPHGCQQPLPYGTLPALCGCMERGLRMHESHPARGSLGHCRHCCRAFICHHGTVWATAGPAHGGVYSHGYVKHAPETAAAEGCHPSNSLFPNQLMLLKADLVVFSSVLDDECSQNCSVCVQLALRRVRHVPGVLPKKGWPWLQR